MTDKIEAIATDTIGDIAARVAGAMEAAVKDYGPDAVDLALMAYRVDAAQSMVAGIGGVALAFVSVVGLSKLWAATQDEDGDFSEGKSLARVFGSIAGVALGVVGIGGATNLFSVTGWLAVFGYPELLIATKALQAAGLL